MSFQTKFLLVIFRYFHNDSLRLWPRLVPIRRRWQHIVLLERDEARLKLCATGDEGSWTMGTHTLAFLLLTGRDEIGLERGPNKDMSVVVCVQPKEHPRIEEAKKSRQEARSWFSFIFR